MNKKTKRIFGAIIGLILVIFAIFGWRTMNADHGKKDIIIQIIVNDAVIYDNTVDTNAATLAELLKEMAESGEIQLHYQNSTYGMYIQGMGTSELYTENTSEKKYWTYSSENNVQCTKAGFCDSADNLLIADGDSFVFTLTSFE